MPKPPDIDGLAGLKFITNYFLAGCSPPTSLFVDFSGPPAEDVFMMLVSLDATDIVQGMLNPGSKRRARPGRHGRKRTPIISRFPDVSDMVGERMSSKTVVKGIRMSPARYAFPIINAYEGINFSAAIVEGLSDTAYSTFWGMVFVNPHFCREFARFSRSFEWDFDEYGPYVVAGAGPPINGVAFEKLDFNNGFNTTFETARHDTIDWTLSVTITVLARPGGNYNSKGRAAIGVLGGGTLELGQSYDLSYDDSATVTVTADVEPGQTVYWGLADRSSIVWVMDGGAVGWADVPIFQ